MAENYIKKLKEEMNSAICCYAEAHVACGYGPDARDKQNHERYLELHDEACAAYESLDSKINDLYTMIETRDSIILTLIDEIAKHDPGSKEGWLETIAILQNPEAVKGIEEAVEDMRQGRYISHEEIWRS